ncbi:MAG: DUF5682 family protein [Acidobacteriota bacterium]
MTARGARGASATPWPLSAPTSCSSKGPPDAADVLPLARQDPAIRPPSRCWSTHPTRPRRAVFYPFALLSVAGDPLRARTVAPVRFIDLPFAHRAGGTEEAGDDAPIPPRDPEKPDPLSVLAEAAGFADHELWWDAEIERRRDATGVFQGIAEAMAALRSESPGPEGEEALREAWMRQAIRAAAKEGFARIAVVCGAWHAPVLADPGPAKADAALLKGLPKRKVAATWIPWTHARLTFASGYGAGVASPGWYEHLFTAPEKATIRWAAHAARLLREQDLDASSASVIEATRLADALASLREQRSPGLAELDDALLAVLCRGEQAPLALIRNRLAIGDTLGQVPETAPRVPLREDLAAELARLKLKPSTEKKTLDLDLRRDVDRGRSRLLHRLSALGIDWARSQEVRGKAGTFHEVWEVHYRPELEVAIIEASVWGNAVSDAAAARIESAARNAEIATLTPLLDQAILAELPSAASFVLAMLQRSAALSADVPRLMGAIPALARIARYGDVRAPTEHILRPRRLFARVVIGLPLDAHPSTTRASRSDGGGLAVHGAVQLLERAGQRDDWVTVLGSSRAEPPRARRGIRLPAPGRARRRRR